MHALTYCISEAAKSLWRRRGTSLLSVLTTAIAMLVLGAFLVVAFNLDRAVAAWSAAAEVTVYLRDDITQDQRVAVNRTLAESALVAARTFVSKSDALARFARDFPDLAASAKALETNPLPASIEVRLRPELALTGEVESLVTRVQVLPGVADVRFDRVWLDRLAALATSVRWTGWVLGAILIFAAVLTVSTVVRLSLHARRDEVEIMTLMGAPLGLLRGPLVVEGLLYGGGGAMVALAALYAAQHVVRLRLDLLMPGVVAAGWLAYLPWQTGLWLVVGGVLVGSAGGLAAARHVR